MSTMEGRNAITMECAAVVWRDGQVLLVRDALGRRRLPGRRVDLLRESPEQAVRAALQALGLTPRRLTLRATEAGVMLYDARVEGEPRDELFIHPEWVGALDAQWALAPATAYALARFAETPEPPEEKTAEAGGAAGAKGAPRAHGKVSARVALEQAGKIAAR